MKGANKLKAKTTAQMLECLLVAIDKLKHVESPEFDELLKLADECRKQGKPVKRTVDLPDWLPGHLWDEYVDTRKSMKKHPMSKGALDLAVISIAKTRDAGYSVDDIMEALIANGWRTVKPAWMAKQLESDSAETLHDRARRLQIETDRDSYLQLEARS